MTAPAPTSQSREIRTGADVLEVSPVVPVVVIEELQQAVPLAQALLRGHRLDRGEPGLGAQGDLDDGYAAAQVPGMVVGAGTVVTPEQVHQVRDAGAQFLVTPGSPPRLLEAALGSGLPLLAGAGTLTEMLTLAEAGLTAMKFFPAEASGGRAYLSAVAAPCPQLRFCPTGGITPDNAPDYLALANVGCVGGSWLTPKDAVAQGDWARIEALAAQAAGLRS